VNIPEATLNEWLETLKDKADGLYRDSRWNSGITKEELFCEAEGIIDTVDYILGKIKELKNGYTNQ
jgi:hypothetical protein